MADGQTETIELTVGGTAASPDPLTKEEKNLQDAEAAFAPLPHGRWGCDMWRWYCCGGNCCSSDGIVMHSFFVVFVIGIGLLIGGLNGCGQQCPEFVTYFGALLYGFFVAVLTAMQLRNVLRYRMDAAIGMDNLVEFRTQQGDLDDNIAAAAGVRDRLQETHDTTLKTTQALKRKFNDLKKWTNESRIISDQSNKIGLLLADKLLKMMEDLQQELVATEHGLLESIYNAVQLRDDGKPGLNRNEFTEFVNKLPAGYKQRFKFQVGGFDDLAGDDGIFDRQELFQYLDQIAENEALKSEEQQQGTQAT